MRENQEISGRDSPFLPFIGTIWLETPARIPSIMYVSGCCTLFRCELPRLILGLFRTLIRGQSLDAPDNFPRARLAPFQWDSVRKRGRGSTYYATRWTTDETEARWSARHLLENLYAFTIARERERSQHPGSSSLCPINECSHFVRCAATELNEIADEGEIGAARNGKKGEAWRGSFTLFLARLLFCRAKRRGLHAWTWTTDRNYSKWMHRSNDFLLQLPPSNADSCAAIFRAAHLPYSI